jgi:hypothetical protein
LQHPLTSLFSSTLLLAVSQWGMEVFFALGGCGEEGVFLHLADYHGYDGEGCFFRKKVEKKSENKCGFICLFNTCFRIFVEP